MAKVSACKRLSMFRQAGIGHFGVALTAALLIYNGAALSAEGYQVVYSFDATNGSPSNGVIKDMDGNIVGIARGNIFRLTPQGAFSVLADIDGPPGGELTLDVNGAIYGTTTDSYDGDDVRYTSSVFKYQKPGGIHKLYEFGTEYSEGGTAPQGRLAIDEKGQVFGTVSQAFPSYGLVFKITDGKEHIIHGFGGQDGVFPVKSAIVLDASHNLYGTTFYGGAFDKGVVFKIAPDKTYTILHSFTGADGANPEYGVILDKDGNVYGNTSTGGSNNTGVVFKIAPDGTATTLYSFNGGNGVRPSGALIRDAGGILYGTASGGLHRKGTVYKVTPGGQAFVLHNFGESATDGAYPVGRLASDGNGYIYGATVQGGKHGYGTVFRLPR